jgi:hypothetical protein
VGVINKIEETDEAPFHFVYEGEDVRGTFHKTLFTPKYLEICKSVPTERFLANILISTDLKKTVKKSDIEALFTRSEFQPTADVPQTVVGQLTIEEPVLKTLIRDAFPDPNATLPLAGPFVDEILKALEKYKNKDKQYDVPFPCDADSLGTLPYDFLNTMMRGISGSAIPNETES